MNQLRRFGIILLGLGLIFSQIPVEAIELAQTNQNDAGSGMDAPNTISDSLNITLNETYFGVLESEVGDTSDVYDFDIVSTGKIQIQIDTVEFKGNDDNIVVSVFNDENNYVYYPIFIPPENGANLTIYSFFPQKFKIRFGFSGTYLLYSFSVVFIESYELPRQNDAGRERDASEKDTPLIEFGQIVTGILGKRHYDYMGGPDQSDYFLINFLSSGHFTVELSLSGDLAYLTQIEIMEGNKKITWNTPYLIDLNFSFKINIPYAGSYKLIFTNFDDDANVKYSFTVGFEEGDYFQANESGINNDASCYPYETSPQINLNSTISGFAGPGLLTSDFRKDFRDCYRLAKATGILNVKFEADRVEGYNYTKLYGNYFTAFTIFKFDSGFDQTQKYVIAEKYDDRGKLEFSIAVNSIETRIHILALTTVNYTLSLEFHGSIDNSVDDLLISESTEIINQTDEISRIPIVSYGQIHLLGLFAMIAGIQKKREKTKS